MTQVRLISTDFDGTLIGLGAGSRCVPPLARALARFKAGGGLWAINTGRTLEHVVHGLADFGAPVEPDFLLTSERDIFHRPRGPWEPLGTWNAVCRERHERLFAACEPLFGRIRELAETDDEVTLIEEEGQPAGLVTRTEAAMDRAVAQIDAWRAGVPKFAHQRNTVYLRFCHADYHKGSALGELARVLEVDRAEVFAIGDHFNDLPMLDGRFAGRVGCPANAIEPVKSAVRSQGGFLAEAPFGAGTAAALDSLAPSTAEKRPATV